jgi:U3 small nucleolar RNA-associated protein 21
VTALWHEIDEAGVGGVIHGWDMGCLGMTVGEERMLEIPAHEGESTARCSAAQLTARYAEGYGEQGFPAWGIPPGGTLLFTLECLSIR